MALTKVSGDFIQDGSIAQGHLHASHGITTSDIGEGSNLYFTTARVDSRIGDLSTSDLSEGTNLYYTQARFNTAFAAKSTSDLSEGTNLYYTDARVGSYLTTNSYATQSYVNTQVSNLVDSAPSTLDTLNELAAALGDDANFSTTVTNSIATKLPLAGGTLTGALSGTSATFSGIGQFAGAIRITETGTSQNILIGNQDSGGVNKPAMINGANGHIRIGYGNSWTGEGGTFTSQMTFNADGAQIIGSSSSNNAFSVNRGDGGGQAFRVQNAGEVVVSNNYFYANGGGTSMYVQNTAVFRGSILNDGTAGIVIADDLTVNDTLFVSEYIRHSGNTNSHIRFQNNRIGIFANSGTAGYIDLHDNGNVYIGASNSTAATFTSSGVTFTGTITASGYNNTNWDTAYGWGNHASAGYLTSFDITTQTDPKYLRSNAEDTTTGSLIIDNDWGSGTYSDSLTIYGTYPSFSLRSTNSNSNTGSTFLFHTDSTGDIQYYFSTTGTNENWTKRFSFYNNGRFDALTQIRTPILYDQNNTNAYIDLNIGNLVLLESAEYAGGMTVKNAGASGYLNMSITTDSHADGWGWRFANQHGHTGSVTKYFWVTYNAGDAYASGSFRAPIFYDSDNTSYYLNPNSTSQISQMAIGTTSWDTTNLTLDVSGSASFRNGFYMGISTNNYGSWSGRIYVSGSSQYWNGQAWSFNGTGWGGGNYWTLDNSGNSIAYGSHRAPIFYDSNDTSYYLDPNNQLSLKVYGEICNSNYAEGNLQPGALNLGRTDTDYRWTGSTWSSDVKLGILLNFSEYYEIGFHDSSDSVNSFVYYNGTDFEMGRDLGWGTQHFTFTESVRTPIFYDSNDTGYYLNPASDSRINNINVDGGGAYPLQTSSSQRYMVQVRHTGNSTNANYGWWWFMDTNFNMGFHADGAADRLTLTRDGDLIIGQTSVSYTSNDNTPVVGSNTTNRLHINGSIQLTNNNDALVIGRGTASFFKDEEIGFGWGGGWYMTDGTYLRVRNNVAVYSTGYIYAGLYYDSDNTGFYVNPSGTSNLSTLSTDTNEGIFNNQRRNHSTTQNFNDTSLRAGINYLQQGTNGPTGTANHQWYGWRLGLGGEYGTQTGSSNHYAQEWYIARKSTGGNNTGGNFLWTRDMESGGWGSWSKIDTDRLQLASGYSVVMGSWGLRNVTPNGYIEMGPANSGHAHIYTDRSNFYFNAQIQLLGGSLINQNDIRAQIFYDLNNTAYYADPSAISSLWGVAIRGDNGSTATDNQIFFWSSGNTTTSAIGFKANGGYFTNPTGNGDGYNTYFTMDTNGRGWVFRRGNGGSNFGSAYDSGWILNNGVWQANSSMRSPIFYDSNNTGYYADPSSLSVMHSLKLIEHQNHTPRWDFSAYVVESPHHYSTSGSGAMYVGETNTIYLRTTAISTGDHRAPIYYDYTNTGYYANPDSNSNLYSVSLYNISTISRLQSGGNLNGAQNFAFGNSQTLGSSTSNSSNNAAIGHSSQASNSSGDSNFSFGYASLYSLSSGSHNIAIGDACGYNITSGSNNLLFGHNAGRTGYQSSSQSIAGITTGSNQIQMGNESHTNAYIQISWTVNSDARDKTDITPIDVGLDFVNKLNPVTFRWDKRSDYEDRTPTGENKLEELTLGFLAQEVEEVEKSYGYDVATKTNLVVDRDVEQDHFGITYEKMIPILTKAIQEQQIIINNLKSRIETLENQ